jgi:hypothetical protein
MEVSSHLYAAINHIQNRRNSFPNIEPACFKHLNSFEASSSAAYKRFDDNEVPPLRFPKEQITLLFIWTV